MANPKTFVVGGEGTETCYLFAQRVSDGYWLQESDGTFGESQDNLAMTPVLDAGGLYLGYYELIESRTAWLDGIYRVAMGPSTGTGVFRSLVAKRVRVVGDTIMEHEAVAAVVARNAAAPGNAAAARMENTLTDLVRRLSVIESRLSAIEQGVRSTSRRG